MSVVLVPALDTSIGIPEWVAKRGGDVRARDLRDGRDVYGAHAFQLPGDIRLTNGILRADVGPRNANPRLTVSVYKGGAWRAMGYLMLSEANVLAGARLVSVTPERATVALEVRNEGTVLVRLHRGERALHIVHGSTLAPAVSAVRRCKWRNALPGVPGPGEGYGEGLYGDGIYGGTGVPDPIVNGSPIVNGFSYETTVDDGVTRQVDANGLTRALMTLHTGAVKPFLGGLGMQRVGVSVDFQAFVATQTTGDDLSDVQRQMAAASEQETRVR